MKAKVVTPFQDKEANTLRKSGEVFECSDSRFSAINSTEYGVLVEAVEEERPKGRVRRSVTKKD